MPNDLRGLSPGGCAGGCWGCQPVSGGRPAGRFSNSGVGFTLTAAAAGRPGTVRRGLSGYIYHPVPVAVYCWLRAGGAFRIALEDAIGLGGDTDTVGAIVGALCGATAGARGIPQEWVGGIVEWPRSERWMRELA